MAFFHENYGEEREVFFFGKVSTICRSSRYDSMYKHFQHEEAPNSSPHKRVHCGCCFRAKGDASIFYLIMAFLNLMSDFVFIIGECDAVKKYFNAGATIRSTYVCEAEGTMGPGIHQVNIVIFSVILFYFVYCI